MIPIFIEDIIKAVSGTLNKNINTNDIFIENVSIDTRNIKQGDLFIPIKGENFDGHDFIENAFKSGAKICFSERDIQTDGILIKVDDTRKALRDLAEFYISLFKIPIVAITGSAGKTTTKDMIASVLSQKFNVVKTEGNFNNEIGLPLTVFNINSSTEVAVLEMGMNNFGEIRNLSKIAKPDVAVITNIGLCHVENLGSLDGVFRAKYEIFDYLKPNGIKILNADDETLSSIKKASGNTKFTNFYSLKNKDTEAFATNITENGIEGIFTSITYFGETIDLKIPLPGKHMIYNAMAAILVGHNLGVSKEMIKYGIENFKSTKMRMDIIKAEKFTLINDVYNANPSSMKASLGILANAKTRKVAILGDMFELGDFSEKEHFEIGKYAVEKEIDSIICIGELAYYIFKGAKEALENVNKKIVLKHFKTQEDFFKVIWDILLKDDTILIKASRGMKFEQTVDKIKR